jgi:hypothetical protein
MPRLTTRKPLPSAPIYSNLAAAYLDSGDPKSEAGAEQALKKSIDLSPSYTYGPYTPNQTGSVLYNAPIPPLPCTTTGIKGTTCTITVES